MKRGILWYKKRPHQEAAQARAQGACFAHQGMVLQAWRTAESKTQEELGLSDRAKPNQNSEAKKGMDITRSSGGSKSERHSNSLLHHPTVIVKSCE